MIPYLELQFSGEVNTGFVLYILRNFCVIHFFLIDHFHINSLSSSIVLFATNTRQIFIKHLFKLQLDMFSAKTMQIWHIFWDLVFRWLDILHRTTIKVHLLGVYAASSSPGVSAGLFQLSLYITSRDIIHISLMSIPKYGGKKITLRQKALGGFHISLHYHQCD